MKILLTGAFKYTDEQIEYLKSQGHQLVFHKNEFDKIPFDVSDIDGVICNALFLNNPIKSFKSLKLIQLTSAGYDRVPIDYIKENSIKLFNARGVYSAPMAEFAVCGVLQLYKQSSYFYENKKKHLWEKHRGLLELCGKRVLIVGCGSIGSETAKRFKVFDAEVIGIDLCPKDNEFFDMVYPLNHLDNCLGEADIVVLSLPLTEENQHFFDDSKFQLMKPSALFVNISRGRLVDETSLISALEHNIIGGAVLDVFEEEPLAENSRLWDMENVVLTPHNSFVGENNNGRMFDIIKNNLRIFV